MKIKQVDDAFREALKNCVEELGWGGKTKLAESLEVAASYIHQLISGRSYGSEAHRRQIAQFFGYSSYDDFLELGFAILENRPIPSPEPKYLSSDELTERGFFTVPFSLEMRLSAGGGGTIQVDDDEDKSSIIIHGPTLGYHNSNNLQAFRVGGESMEPLIGEGGIVLVDKTHNRLERLKDGSVYVGCWESDGECQVKRLRWAEEGVLVAIESVNPMFPIIYKKPKDFYQLIGKVVWIWRELT